MDGSPQVRGRLRGISPAVSSADRAREGGRDAHLASAASPFDPLLRHGGPGRVARGQRHRTRLLRQRGRAAHRQGSRAAPLRSNRRDLRSRIARLPERPVAHVRLDRRGYRTNILLLRGGGMNRYRLMHTTEFVYDGPVSESYNEVRLRPMHDEKQSCLSFHLTTTPGSRGTAYRDSHGNWVHQFNVLSEHRLLKVEAESVVLAHEMPETPADPSTLADFDSRRDQMDEEYFDFMAATAYVPHLSALKQIIEAAEGASDGTVAGFAQAASDSIHNRFL